MKYRTEALLLARKPIPTYVESELFIPTFKNSITGSVGSIVCTIPTIPRYRTYHRCATVFRRLQAACSRHAACSRPGVQQAAASMQWLIRLAHRGGRTYLFIISSTPALPPPQPPPLTTSFASGLACLAPRPSSPLRATPLPLGLHCGSQRTR